MIIRQTLIELGAYTLGAHLVVSMQSDYRKSLTDVRRDLDRFLALVKELDMAVVWVHHFNKGPAPASNRISGTHAHQNIPRSVHRAGAR